RSGRRGWRRRMRRRPRADSWEAGNEWSRTLTTPVRRAQHQARKRPRTRPATCGKALKRTATALRPPAHWKALALLRLEARVRLVDHIDDALAAHDLAVAVATLERLERAADLHGRRPEAKQNRKAAGRTCGGAVRIERAGPG